MLPESLFRQLLERERNRCDRIGGRLAILMMRGRADGTREVHQRELIQAIRDRVRSTDWLGRLGDELAVMLLDTEARGAEVVARSLCEPIERHTVHRRIVTYPDAPGGGTGSHREDPGLDPQSESEPSSGRTSGGGGRREAPSSPGGRDGDSPDGSPASLSFHELIKRPLPPWKRAVDLGLGSLLLGATLPLMLVAGLLIRLTSPGPALYRQTRMGWGGRPFLLYKFRTMREGAEDLQRELRHLNEQTGPVFKLRRDPRVTPVGRVLRRFSIDELPQLVNVLRGDMSLVGPRPLPIAEACQCTGWLHRRHETVPGITCLWQVSGRSEIPFEDWVRMDLRYARRQSLWLDLSILLRTVPAVIGGRGAH